MISYEMHDSIALLKMDHGKVNAMDVEFLSSLIEQLENIRNSSANAIIVTGREKIFSAGVDLFRLLREEPKYVDRFLPLLSEAFEKFFLFPKPVIAAVNGHAIAGGCILTCASDLRIMVDGAGRVGLTELLVGVPFPTIALEIVRFSTPPQFLQEVVYTGATYSPQEALQRGLIDEIVVPEKLMERAFQLAQHMAGIPAQSFKIVKHVLRAPTAKRVVAANEATREINEAWKDPQVHTKIRQYLDRTVRKK